MTFLASLLGTYGPLIVLVGTFFEGETIVALGGFAAHQGLVDPVAVAVCAFVGTFAGDQTWFYLGRRHADYAIVQRLTNRPSFARALGMIERHAVKFILTFRFIYGLRTISPVAVGFSRVPARKFMLLNGLAGAVWAVAFTAAGYVFGTAFETFLGNVQAVEYKVLLAIGIVVLLLIIHQVVRSFVLRRNHDDAVPGE